MRIGMSTVLLVTTLACSAPPHGAETARYVPRRRDVTLTTVPYLVREMTGVLPFLKEALAKGGVLEGKEVYGFVPSSVTVVEGDTLHFTFINPEDDVHAFVLPDFAVSLPGNSVTTRTYVARRAGLYRFTCAIVSHQPMMAGDLVVLSPAAIAASADAPSSPAR